MHIEQSVRPARASAARITRSLSRRITATPNSSWKPRNPREISPNPDDYYQAIRYGWNKKNACLFTDGLRGIDDFDCRYMPDITIMNRKIEYIHYEQYADEETFARIFHLFGREAVANGSIEKARCHALAHPHPARGACGLPALHRAGRGAGGRDL